VFEEETDLRTSVRYTGICEQQNSDEKLLKVKSENGGPNCTLTPLSHNLDCALE
jgi:hypothetical protein